MREVYSPDFLSMVEFGTPISKLEMRMKGSFSRDKDWIAQVRAHDEWDRFGEFAFLGDNESLLAVIHTDSQIVTEYHTTHEEIANVLREVITGRRHPAPGFEFISPASQEEAGRNFYFIEKVFGGRQPCPWFCGVEGGNAGTLTKTGLSDDDVLEAKVSQIGALEASPELIKMLLNSNSQSLVRQAETTLRIRTNMRKRKELFYIWISDLLPHLIESHHFFEGKGSSYRADPAFLIEALGLSNRAI